MRYGYIGLEDSEDGDDYTTDLDDPEASGYYGAGDAALFGGIRRRVSRAAKRASRAVKKTARRATKTSINAATLGQAKHIKRGLRQLSNNPVWNIAQTGASFIPGVGTAVSSGMATAAAWGRGASLRDAALAAARAAVPGGPAAQAAFDVGIGLAKGKRLDRAALAAVRNQVPGGPMGKIAFDSALAVSRGEGAGRAAQQGLQHALRSQVKGRMGRMAFDNVVRAARGRRLRAPRIRFRQFPQLNQDSSRIADMLQRRRVFRRLPLRQLARRGNVRPLDARNAFAAFLNMKNRTNLYGARDVGEMETFDECCQRHGYDAGEMVPKLKSGKLYPHIGDLTVAMPKVPISRALVDGLYAKGNQRIKQAILAHGFKARTSYDAGELVGDRWTIRSGDVPYKVAATVTGDAGRWRELAGANPGMLIKTIEGVTQLVPWRVNQKVLLPQSWLGTAKVPEPPDLPSPPSRPPAPTPPTAPPIAGPAVPGTVIVGPGGRLQYIVLPGDWPVKIAREFTGDASRWRELRGANPQKATGADGSFKTLNAGERLWWPGGWPTVRGGGSVQVEPPPPKPAPAPPAPKPAPPATKPPVEPNTGLGLIEAELAYFYQKHSGDSPAPPTTIAPIYGTTAADFDGVWDARAIDAMSGFQRWLNKRSGIYGGIKRSIGTLPENGQPDMASVAALQSVVERDLTDSGSPGLPKGPTVPAVPAVPGVPAPPPGGGGAPPAKKKSSGVGPLLALAAGYFFL